MAEGAASNGFGIRSATADQAGALTRCAEFTDTLRYCLSYGWTTQSEATAQKEVQQAILVEATARGSSPESTGDLALADALRQRSALSPSQRAEADRAELESAAAGIEEAVKIEQMRRTSFAATFAAAPTSLAILQDRVKDQNEKYWCGPASMMMIHWNHGSNAKVSQATWASRLGTTTSGTSVTAMVNVTNNYTNWDAAGAYGVINVSGWSFEAWMGLNVHRVGEAHRPVILHPQLLMTYFPYLDTDGSGHFQVGRGYDLNGSGPADWRIGYYEPWNPQKFSSSRPFVERIQWRKAKKSWKANLAHPQHNLGA